MKFLPKIISVIFIIILLYNQISSQWVIDVEPYYTHGGPYYINVIDTGTIWCLGYKGFWDTVSFFTKSPEYGWQWGNGNNLPLNVQYTCIAGINSTTAFVGDQYGHVYKTTNYSWGDWELILNAGQNYWITDIKFSRINRNVGYVFSALSIYTSGVFKIYKTTDYGNTWQLFTPFFGNYLLGNKPQVWVTDSEHAWMGLWTSSGLQPATVAYTTNGGLNWLTSSVEPNRHGIEAVAFSYNNQFGMVVTHRAFYPKNRLNSTNGGLNWNLIDTVRQGNVLSLINVPETSVWYMNGQAYYLDNTIERYVYKSSNNGFNWIRMTTVDSTEVFADMDAVKLDDKIYAWATGFSRIYKLIDTAVVIGINNQGGNVPMQFKLEQNYPNPFNPVTKINYELNRESFVKIIVYNSLGQKIKELINEYKPAGRYDIKFDGSNLPSGLYFYGMFTPNYIEYKKAVLLK